MVKKLLTLFFGLIAATSLMAQPKSVTINESDIQFWVGTGSNSTVVAIGWDDEDASYTPTVVVWGIHWNSNITLQNALDTVMAYDSRFSYTISGGYVSGVSYNDPTNGVSLTPSAGWNCNNYGGAYGSTNLSSTWLRISESTCNDYNFSTVNNLIYASNPNGSTTLPDTVDAALPFSEILYWVGTGSDSAEFIVNFANPDTAFAWGYLFNGSTTAQAMIDAIAAADPRFWSVGTPSVDGDIHFLTDNGDTLGLSPVDPNVGWNFWWTNLNGVSAASGSASTLHNGDVFKYGDLNSATGWDEAWGFYMEEAWNTIPTPVPAPTVVLPEDASFDATDILYWVGEGSNEVVFAVNWADTALAWGYRFNSESVALSTVMSDIAAADPRFSYQTGDWGLNDINFVTDNGTLGISPSSYWWSLLNHVGGMGMADVLSNGDFYKWGDLSIAVVTDSTWVDEWGGYWDYTYVWPYEISPVSVPTPVDPSVVEATIDASAIEYWVGEGSNQVIMAINWPDTALAWGYRFNGSKTVGDMMNDIAAADPRFSIVTGTYGIDDILFVRGNGDTLHKAEYSWWSSTNNGVMDAGIGQTLANNDFEKWADGTTGVLVDSNWVEDWGGYWNYIYVYPMTIHAVTQPAGAGPFCGIVGSEGCTAIACTDNRIKGWATGCEMVLGSSNLTNPDAPVVSYGTAEEAIGPATTSTLDVVSLGDGGSATLTFEHPITNGEGYDFAVFENSFNDYFLELGYVEVSSDGVNFVRFPATSLTQTARQIVSAVDPTYINNLAGKYKVGYGTPFDLNELRDSANVDINSITHVRIVDVIGSIDPQYATYDAFGHMVNDPFPTITYSSGFDLDGIAVLNQKVNSIDGTEDVAFNVYPNPANDYMTVSVMSQGTDRQVVMFDMSGRTVLSTMLAANASSITLSTSTLNGGVYMLRVGNDVMKVVIRH